MSEKFVKCFYSVHILAVHICLGFITLWNLWHVQGKSNYNSIFLYLQKAETQSTEEEHTTTTDICPSTSQGSGKLQQYQLYLDNTICLLQIRSKVAMCKTNWYNLTRFSFGFQTIDKFSTLVWRVPLVKWRNVNDWKYKIQLSDKLIYILLS